MSCLRRFRTGAVGLAREEWAYVLIHQLDMGKPQLADFLELLFQLRDALPGIDRGGTGHGAAQRRYARLLASNFGRLEPN